MSSNSSNNFRVRVREKQDDVVNWKHFPCYWPFVPEIHLSPVNSPHKGQWRRALMFSLICAWTNGWVNNRDASDLRSHHAYYDITVMFVKKSVLKIILLHVFFHTDLKITPLSSSWSKQRWIIVFFIYIIMMREVYYVNGLAQDCSISIAYALEILQSCTKPSMYSHLMHSFTYST